MADGEGEWQLVKPKERKQKPIEMRGSVKLNPRDQYAAMLKDDKKAAFVKPEKKKEKKKPQPTNVKPVEVKAVVKKEKKQPLAALSKTFDVKTLKEELNAIRERYPSSAEGQLLAAADLFFRRFENVEDASAQLPKKFEDRVAFPMDVFRENNQMAWETMTVWLSSIEQTEREQLFARLLKTIDEKPGAANLIGLRLLLQLLLVSSASLFSPDNVKQRLAAGNLSGNKAIVANTLWLASTLLDIEPSAAFAVWNAALLPAIHNDKFNLREEGLNWFTELLDDEVYPVIKKRMTTEPFPIDAFQRLLAIRTDPQVPELQKIMTDKWDRILNLSFFFQPSSPRKFFTHFLRYAAASFHISEVVLPILARALATDEKCYDLWKSQFSQFMAASSNLMLYLTRNWDEWRSKLSKQRLLSLVDSFDQIAQKSGQVKETGEKESEQVILVTQQTCKSLKAKLRGSGFCGSLLTFVGVSVGLATLFAAGAYLAAPHLCKDVSTLPRALQHTCQYVGQLRTLLQQQL